LPFFSPTPTTIGLNWYIQLWAEKAQAGSHLLLKVADIIAGVAFMHSLDVVHGDLKTVGVQQTSFFSS
jgi:hypothetical protein